MHRTTIWIGVSGLLLGVAAVHVYSSRYALALLGGPPRAVLVTTHDLSVGDVLSRAVLDFRELPERFVEERHLEAEQLELVLGSRVGAPLRSGSTLLWTDLELTTEPRTLANLVQTGKRAFSLPERELDFDGLLRPGDRVDVLFTEATADAAVSTRRVLQSALVLSVGAQLGDARGPSRTNGRVTLSVTVEQAEQLAQHEGRGRFRLALRNPADLVLADGESLEALAEPHASRAAHADSALTSALRGAP